MRNLPLPLTARRVEKKGKIRVLQAPEGEWGCPREFVDLTDTFPRRRFRNGTVAYTKERDGKKS